MIGAKHPAHAEHSHATTPADSFETIKEREAHSAKWLVSYAEAARNGSVSAALVLGAAHPRGTDGNPVDILNKYA
jgi:hypothetical protein